MFPDFSFPWVSILYRVGEGELEEIFEKDALFYGSLSPPIFIEGRGESVHRLFYEGDKKLQKVMNTIMNTETVNTFPKTFVWDRSRYFYHNYFPSSHACFYIFL